MEAWIDQLAVALGEDGLSREEVGRLLGVSRDVAHRVERKVTPLAAFLLGAAFGRSVAGGASRAEAMSTAVERLEALLPEEPRAPGEG
jgi:uncharacterized protein DUF6457